MSRNAWFVALGSLFAALVLVAAWVIRTPSPAPPAPEPMVFVAPPQPPPEDDLEKKLMAKKSIADAFKMLQVGMSEVGASGHDAAANLLAVWSAERLTWAGLSEAPETTFGKVMKDVEAERGKRLCAAGVVIEIEVDRKFPRPMYRGGLSSTGGVVRFIAVHSTGELVSRSPARICGAVTGRESYENSGGGTTHAVQVVGIFDLPENRKP